MLSCLGHGPVTQRSYPHQSVRSEEPSPLPPAGSAVSGCILPYDKPIHPLLLSLTKYPANYVLVELATRITGGQSGVTS